jgi:broad specificity phosphatase PhoE
VTDLLLVRHGQSEWNALGRWQGHADPPLTELGRQQARHAADRLAPLARIVTSDLRRAAETADIIGERWSAEAPTRVTALRERDAGPWQGLTHDEIAASWPGFLESGQRPDGFEDDASLLARVLPALAALDGSAAIPTLVVTHGGVLRTLERHHDLVGDRVPNLGGRWYHVEGATIRPGEAVVLVGADELTRPEET